MTTDKDVQLLRQQAQTALTRCHAELSQENVENACVLIFDFKQQRMEVVDEMSMLSPQANRTPYAERVAQIEAVERWCIQARQKLEHLIP
jgi:hypothetical protein